MSYNPELQALRELANWILPSLNCWFCEKPIGLSSIEQGFGHRRHRKVTTEFTIHHRDENRENNEWNNTVICHPVCHKRYHAQKRKEAKA